MIRKDQIVLLVGELKQRSGRKYKDVIADMAKIPDVLMTHDIFQSKFRRFVERETTYSEAEIVALIEAFSQNGGQTVCTALEALLLCSWAGIGLNALGIIGRYYPADDISAGLHLVTQRLINVNTVDWSDPVARQNILDRLDQVRLGQGSRRRDGQASGFAADLPAGKRQQVEGRRPAPVTVLRDASSLPGLPDDLGKLDYGDLTRLIQRTRRDVQNGHTHDAEGVLMKLLHKVDPRYSEPKHEIHHQLGILHIKRADYAAAHQHLGQALALIGESDLKNAAAIRANMGANAFYRGDHATAQTYFKQSLAQAEATQDYQIIMFLKNIMGLVALEKREHQVALQLHDDARRLAEQSNDQRRLAYIYMNLGILHEQKQRQDLAKNAFNRSLDYAEQSGDSELVVHVNWHMGSLETRNDNLRGGESRLKQALIWAEKLGLDALESNIYITLGRLYIQEHQFSLAQHSLRLALSRAISIRQDENIARALYGIALAVLAEQFVIGPGDVQAVLSHLAFMSRDPFFAHVPPQALQERWLQSAAYRFQIGLPNFPALSRYRIEEALPLIFATPDRQR